MLDGRVSTGGVVSATIVLVIDKLTAVEAGEVLPAASVAFAVTLCVAIDNPVVGVADQVPVLVAVAVAIGVVLVPSYSLTVDNASAVPAKVGVVSVVLVPLDGLDIVGANGATVSIVMLIADEAGDVLPALSVAFAVML
jgi:hypothetical protein